MPRQGRPSRKFAGTVVGRAKEAWLADAIMRAPYVSSMKHILRACSCWCLSVWRRMVLAFCKSYAAEHHLLLCSACMFSLRVMAEQCMRVCFARAYCIE